MARVLSRCHTSEDQEQNAALALRRDLRLRRASAKCDLGQSMDPLYREMILGKGFVPVSKLSAAFLQPKSPMHLQFAYYESSLVVEYWIEKYGIEVMRRLLDDLSIGMPAAEALKRAPGTLELLDKEFQEYAVALASKYGEGVDFERADEEEEKVNAASWLAGHPENYWALRSQCVAHIKAKKWDDALAIANKLKNMVPNDDSNEGIYALLARIHRGKGNEPTSEQPWSSSVNDHRIAARLCLG